MMKHLLNAPKVGVLLAILAMGSLAACEQLLSQRHSVPSARNSFMRWWQGWMPDSIGCGMWHVLRLVLHCR